MDSKPAFRNPNGGRRFLRALFFEEALDDKTYCLYTLKREDHLGYPSLMRLYLEEADPTEYRFASKYLDGWSHWVELSGQSWFQPYVSEWRQELEVRLRSEALAHILAVSKDATNNNAYHANKYLLEGSWKPTGESKRGRPSKDEVKLEIKRLAASKAQIDEDAQRLGIIN